MAQMTVAQVTTATGMAAGTAVQGDMPVFEKGQTVYYLADVPAAGSNQAIDFSKRYTIEAIYMDYLTSGAPMDQVGLAADKSVLNRAFLGFAHNDTTGAAGSTTSATTTSRAWFYNMRAADGTVYARIHQASITSIAAFEIYAAAQVPNIVT